MRSPEDCGNYRRDTHTPHMDSTSVASPRPPPVQVERDDTPTTPVPVPMIDMETIRRGIDALAESDRLDKDSALTMTRLFHSMETLMRHECTRRDAQISRMECELERGRIQHELDRIANVQIHQQQQLHPGVESTPLRRARSKW